MSLNETVMKRLCPAGGFALVEVLCTFVILAFGLLGIASLFIMTGKLNSSSYIKQQAVQATYDMIERMRANNQAAASGTYNVNNLTSGGAPVLPPQPSPDCSQATCTAGQMAAYDNWVWLTKELATLPNGSGSIQTAPLSGVNTSVTITVQWDDNPVQGKYGSSTNVQGASANLARFVVRTVL